MLAGQCSNLDYHYGEIVSTEKTEESKRICEKN